MRETKVALVLALLAIAGSGVHGCGQRDQGAIPGAPSADSNLFDPGRLRVGDRVHGLVVEDLRLQTAYDSTLVGSVVLGGEVGVRGTRIRHFDGEVDAVCVELDSLSDRRLPRWVGDTRRRWFCFSNDSFARRALEGVPIGAAMEFVIRRLQVVRSYSDAFDTAELVRVIRWTKPAPIRTDADRYLLHPRQVGQIATHQATIVSRFTAPRDTTVYILHCNGAIAWGLQRLDEGVWRDAWVATTNGCLSAPKVVRAGEAHVETLGVVSRTDVPNPGSFIQHEVQPGTYRVVWYQVLTSFDLDARPFGPELGLEQRVSQPFEIEKAP